MTERLFITTWLWGTAYGSEYIDRLKAGVARNLAQPYEFRVFEPQPEDAHLTAIKGCFCRLRAFDPEWQARQGIEPGDRIVCLDLDLIVTGPLDELFSQPEPFGILQGVHASNPLNFNGSVWWLDAGYRPDVWSDFTLEAAAKERFADFPDDQSWMESRLASVAGRVGPETGVFGFCKPGWPTKSQALPDGAKIVAFPGWRDPSGFQHLSFVQEHWRT